MDTEFKKGDKILFKGRKFEFVHYEDEMGHQDILVFKSNTHILRYPALMLLNDLYGGIIERITY